MIISVCFISIIIWITLVRIIIPLLLSMGITRYAAFAFTHYSSSSLAYSSSKSVDIANAKICRVFLATFLEVA